MRKILLATTALAAFAGFSSAANAQITVTLGGYTEFFGAIYDNNLVNGTEREFQLETEIVVKADGKADNGLLYGAKIELQNSTGANGVATQRDHRRGVGLSRPASGVASNWATSTAPPTPWRSTLRWSAWKASTATTPTSSPTPALSTASRSNGPPALGRVIKNPDSSDATKVMYLTPRFAGFQAGFSYTPENGNEGQSVVGTKNTVRLFRLPGIRHQLHRQLRRRDRRRQRHRHQRQRRGTVGAVAGLKDFSAWQVGGQVGYAGFKLGGGYVDADNFNVPARTDSGDQHAWNAGASYTTGPIAVGLTYADAEGYKRALRHLCRPVSGLWRQRCVHHRPRPAASVGPDVRRRRTEDQCRCDRQARQRRATCG